jgi:hypothetical protein
MIKILKEVRSAPKERNNQLPAGSTTLADPLRQGEHSAGFLNVDMAFHLFDHNEALLYLVVFFFTAQHVDML